VSIKNRANRKRKQRAKPPPKIKLPSKRLLHAATVLDVHFFLIQNGTLVRDDTIAEPGSIFLWFDDGQVVITKADMPEMLLRIQAKLGLTVPEIESILLELAEQGTISSQPFKLDESDDDEYAEVGSM